MKRTNVLPVVTLAIIALIASSFTFTAFGQAPVRMSADERYVLCGDNCKAPTPLALRNRNSKAMVQANMVSTSALRRNIGMLLSPGSIVPGSTVPINMRTVDGFPGPVVIEGRQYTTDDNGNRNYLGHAFYASKDLSLTEFGPGYFPSLAPGALIPIGEVQNGNAGEPVTVEVTIYDSVNGGAPLETLHTTFWSQVRTANPGLPVTISTVDVVGGKVITLKGSFPSGVLTVGVGNFQWDASVLQVQSLGNALVFNIPNDGFGNNLYPANWPAETMWSFYIKSVDGETFSFPNVVRVTGNSRDSGVAIVQ